MKTPVETPRPYKPTDSRGGAKGPVPARDQPVPLPHHVPMCPWEGWRGLLRDEVTTHGHLGVRALEPPREPQLPTQDRLEGEARCRISLLPGGRGGRPREAEQRPHGQAGRQRRGQGEGARGDLGMKGQPSWGLERQQGAWKSASRPTSALQNTDHTPATLDSDEEGAGSSAPERSRSDLDSGPSGVRSLSWGPADV